MLHIRVNPGLLRVNANLDGIIDASSLFFEHFGVYETCTTYRFTGTRMLSRRTGEALIGDAAWPSLSDHKISGPLSLSHYHTVVGGLIY